MVDADGLRGAVQMGLVLGIQLAGFFFFFCADRVQTYEENKGLGWRCSDNL